MITGPFHEMPAQETNIITTVQLLRHIFLRFQTSLYFVGEKQEDSFGFHSKRYAFVSTDMTAESW